MTDIKTEVRPDYTTLQGYLAQIQKREGNLGVAYDEVAQDHQNQLKKIIDRLTEITGNDYSEFEVPLYDARSPHSSCYTKIKMEVYAIRMSGLILRLYGQFFYEERNPLDGTPSTVINSSQSQTQKVDIQLLLDVGSKIENNLKSVKDSVEKDFLQKMKDNLQTVSNYADLIKLATTTASGVGLALDKALALIM